MLDSTPLGQVVMECVVQLSNGCTDDELEPNMKQSLGLDGFDFETNLQNGGESGNGAN